MVIVELISFGDFSNKSNWFFGNDVRFIDPMTTPYQSSFPNSNLSVKS